MMEKKTEIILDDSQPSGNHNPDTEDDSSDDANSEMDETEKFVKVNSESLKNRAQTMANITAGIYSKAKAPITADQNSWIFLQSVLLLFFESKFSKFSRR